MSTRWQFSAVTLCIILTAPFTLHADIIRWDTGEVIPGTEGITPGPGVRLDQMELGYADLGGWHDDDESMDLTGANLEASNLSNANLGYSSLINANMSGANLTNAYLPWSILMDANLTGAVVTGADFSREWNGKSTGITQTQLYSTQSYQDKNLSGIGLGSNDLTGCDFREQNLTNAYLVDSRLTNADLTGANLTGVDLAGSPI